MINVTPTAAEQDQRAAGGREQDRRGPARVRAGRRLLRLPVRPDDRRGRRGRDDRRRHRDQRRQAAGRSDQRALPRAPKSTSSTTSPAAASRSRTRTPSRPAAAGPRSACSFRLQAEALIDLHLTRPPPTARSSPSELVLQARAAGLSIISITDHDTTAGMRGRARRRARRRPRARSRHRDQRRRRRPRRPRPRLFHRHRRPPSLRAFLDSPARGSAAPRRARWASAWPRSAVRSTSRRSSTRRARGQERRPSADRDGARWPPATCATRDEAFDRFLEFGGARLRAARAAPRPTEVIAIVHDAGGIASLAHPGVTQRDRPDRRRSPPPDSTRSRRGTRITTPPPKRATAPWRADLGLLVTGGSDFHGDMRHRASRVWDGRRSMRGLRRAATPLRTCGSAVSDASSRLTVSESASHDGLAVCDSQLPTRNRRSAGAAACRSPVAACSARRRVAAAVEKASSSEMISVASERAPATRATDLAERACRHRRRSPRSDVRGSAGTDRARSARTRCARSADGRIERRDRPIERCRVDARIARQRVHLLRRRPAGPARCRA